MNDNYKTTPLYKWTRVCFWILLMIFLPTYFITRYRNEETRYGEDFRKLNTLWFIPTNRVSWESYIMTPKQVESYLSKNVSPKTILKDRSLPSVDPNGYYYIVFRLITDQPRVDCVHIKCYVEGANFPIDFDAYPGESWELMYPYRTAHEFKDCIVPVHIDPNKVVGIPRLSIQWTHMSRF
jgi:hypothetical protein